MASDGFKDAMALVAAVIDGDEDGARVIRENADPRALIDGLVTIGTTVIRVAAEFDGEPPAAGVDLMRSVLRRIS